MALGLVVLAVAGVVLSGVLPDQRLTTPLEVISLLGVMSGSVLLLQAGRMYLLGIGGVLVCGFIAVLLATYAGLVINASSSVPNRDFLSWHVDRPAIVLSMFGFAAALLLLPSAWSPHRRWLQPLLVLASVGLSALAFLIIPTPIATAPVNVTVRMVGVNDPLLVLGVVALALIAPVQVAASVGWVYFWVRSASGVKRWIPAQKLRLAGLIIWTTWLVLGLTDVLPSELGGRFSMWQPLRHADSKVWVIAGAVAVRPESSLRGQRASSTWMRGHPRPLRASGPSSVRLA